MGELAEYLEQHVFVGSHEPDGKGEWLTFRGRQLGSNFAVGPDTPEGERARHFWLYETPEGGNLIYEQETLVEGSIERQPGQPPAKMKDVRADLYSLEEANNKDPVAREIARRFEKGM